MEHPVSLGQSDRFWFIRLGVLWRGALLAVLVLTLTGAAYKGAGLRISAPRRPACNIAPSSTAPKIGEAAPDFALQSASGSSVSLKSYAGKSKLVLVFYRGYW